MTNDLVRIINDMECRGRLNQEDFPLVVQVLREFMELAAHPVVVNLTGAAALTVLDLISNPPEPNEALKNAMKKRREQ
jgi:uncharacterized protein (DUF1778 family)